MTPKLHEFFMQPDHPQNWRDRLEASILHYCRQNGTTPDTAVEAVSAFLGQCPSGRADRAEATHRLHNQMSMMIAAMRQRAREAQETGAPRCDGCIGQARAIAELNRMLDAQTPAGRVDLGELCARLVAALEEAFAPGKGLSIRLTIEPVMVAYRQAQPLLLILNEALTNAVKHGMPAEGEMVSVTLARQTDGRARLAVENAARGRTTPGGAGLGSTIVDALADQAGARLERGAVGAGFRLACIFQPE